MATIDDFESYSVGDLNGQGSWSGLTVFDVSTTNPHEGSQHVRTGGSNPSFGTCVIPYSAASTGTITYYFSFSATNARTYFVFNAGADIITYVGYRSSNMTAFHSGGEASLGSQSLNTYHKIDFEWTSTTFRVRINDGAWSASLSPYQGSSAIPTSIGPTTFSANNGNSDWDIITDDTAVASFTKPNYLGFARL